MNKKPTPIKDFLNDTERKELTTFLTTKVVSFSDGARLIDITRPALLNIHLTGKGRYANVQTVRNFLKTLK